MQENTSQEKSVIVATRIYLKWVGDLVGTILLTILFAGGAIYVGIESIWVPCVICAVVSLALLLYGSIKVGLARRNNKKHTIYVTYKNNVFTIYFDNEKLEINADNIVDCTFKNKKFSVVTPYFVQSGEYNYGRFVIYFKDDQENLYKTVLKNVAYPEKVYDRFVELLGWNLCD